MDEKNTAVPKKIIKEGRVKEGKGGGSRQERRTSLENLKGCFGDVSRDPFFTSDIHVRECQMDSGGPKTETRQTTSVLSK